MEVNKLVEGEYISGFCSKLHQAMMPFPVWLGKGEEFGKMGLLKGKNV